MLVDTRQPEVIAAVVCRLLADRSRAADLAASRAQRVRSAFSPEGTAESWMRLYEELARTPS